MSDQRLPPPDPATYSPRQQEVHDAIASGPRGVVVGPLALWLHRPELAAAAQALGQYCRYDSTLPQELSELAIIVTGAVWKAEFEWGTHAPIAERAGVPAAAIEAIRAGEVPHFDDPRMAAVHDFTREAQADRQVSDETYARTVSLLGEAAVVDLVGILGYYNLISVTLNVFRVPPPEGRERAWG